MRKIEIHKGDRYNRLSIIEEVESEFTSGGNKKRMVKAECECGTVKTYQLNELRTGKTKSCGCYNLEKIKQRRTSHGDSGTRLYKIWKDMRKRCNNPNSTNYNNYGGRGIKVCEEWFIYESFKNWSLINGYSDKLSIDRIDVNGDYEPLNCRWVTVKEQNINTRRQRKFLAISPSGETFEHNVIKVFAEEHGLNHKSISECLRGRTKSHRGWYFKRLDE